MYNRYFRNPWWSDVDQLQREMNRLFTTFGSNRPSAYAGYPAINIWANENEALVAAELPGVALSDLDISVVGDTLTLKGSREQDDLPEETTCYRQEREYGKFTRVYELPFKVDSTKVDAVLQKGVLNIRLPRAEEDKPKKITVKGG